MRKVPYGQAIQAITQLVEPLHLMPEDVAEIHIIGDQMEVIAFAHNHGGCKVITDDGYAKTVVEATWTGEPGEPYEVPCRCRCGEPEDGAK